MKTQELLQIINQHETSTIQFKETIKNINQLVFEIVAMSNSLGGKILIGVSDNSEIKGIDNNDLQRINQYIATATTQHIRPPVTPFTEIVTIDNKIILIVYIQKGLNKPYYTKDGIAYIKKGSDKRIASPEEILRMFQSSQRLFADEQIIEETSNKDILEHLIKYYIVKSNFDDFRSVFKINLEKISITDIPYEHIDFFLDKINYSNSLNTLLKNLKILKKDNLTLAGLLCFGKNPQISRPLFTIDCCKFFGNETTGTTYDNAEPSFKGNFYNIFHKTIDFIKKNIKKIPSNAGFNNQPVWEIPIEIFEELIVNALVHRDYFINSTIKIFIFDNRIEIISPGILPNSLTIKNILLGYSIVRNPILHNISKNILPYRGYGTGIKRVKKLYPDIEFINDKNIGRFVVIIKRKN